MDTRNVTCPFHLSSGVGGYSWKAGTRRNIKWRPFWSNDKIDARWRIKRNVVALDREQAKLRYEYP